MKFNRSVLLNILRGMFFLTFGILAGFSIRYYLGWGPMMSLHDAVSFILQTYAWYYGMMAALFAGLAAFSWLLKKDVGPEDAWD